MEGEFYHLYSRGNSKQKIFLDDRDRDRFLKILYLYNSPARIDFKNDIADRKINAWDFERGEPIVHIGAWVLMPNHFHLYITPKNTEARLPSKVPSISSQNSITDFMHRVLTSYSKYFNNRHQRTGSLFEGKFKSVHIQNNNHAKYLFSYIHLNPLKLFDKKWKEQKSGNERGLKKFLDSYKWSSYSDYLGINRSENKIIHKINFPRYFESKNSFQKEIFDWIKINILDFKE